MSLKETLRLVVEADTKGAVKAVEDVGRATDKSLGKSQKSLDKWGKGLSKVGAGMVGVGAVALVGLGKMAKMSEEANLSTLKLQNTLDNMPKLAGENAKQFTDLATKIQSVTAADADQIVEAEALLGTFNLTAQQIKGITPLVVDYARKFGVDLPKAAVQVGKALDGNIGALKKNGVSIDEAAFKTDHYSAVQKALQDQVGGFARAEGATFSGSLERMKNQLGDLAEGVGGGAVDAFTTMFGAVGKVAGAMEKISPGAQNATGKIAAFGAAGLIAVGGLSTLVGKAIEARANLGRLADGLSSVTGKMGGIGRVAGMAAGAVGIGALVLEARHLNDEANRLDVDKITGALNSISDGGQKAAREMVKVSLAFNHGERDVKQIADASVPAARQFVELAKSLGAPPKLIRELNKAISEKKAEDVGGSAAQAGYTEEVDKATGALKGEADATTSAKDALKDYEDALHALFDPLFGMQDALQNNIDAQADFNAKSLEAAAAEKAYQDAVKQHGPKSKEAAAASLELMGAQQALTDAQHKAVRSAQDVEIATEELRAEIKQNPAALDKAKAHLAQWQRQGLITAGQAKKTAAEFDRLAGAIRRTPSKKAIVVSVKGTGDARTRLLTVRDALGQLHDKTLTIGVTTAIGPQAVGIMESKLLRRAHGGPVHKGQAYIVGEQGEEVFFAPESGTIIPNGRMGASAGGGGGGTLDVRVQLEGSGLLRNLRHAIRTEFGGDVQAALGARSR